MAHLNKSIVDMLELHANTKPNKPAFIFVNASMERMVITRRQLWDYSRKFAAILRNIGIKKGQVVSNTLPNSPHRLITDMATITSGCIAMNGQIGRADGLDFLKSLNQTECTAVILDPDESNNAFMLLEPRLRSFNKTTGEVVCPDVPSLKYVICCPLSNGNRKLFFKDLDNQKEMIHESILPTDVCQYLCTSGSTSSFKMVALNSEGLLDVGQRMVDSLGCKESDKYLSERQLGWLAGFPNIYLVLGCTRVLLDEGGHRTKSYAKCWEIAYNENCDISFAAPFLLNDYCEFLKNCEDNAMRKFRFRTIATGGGPTQASQVKLALDNLCGAVVIMYGSTECGLMTSLRINNLDDYEDFNTGYPHDGIEIKVVGEDGKEVELGEKGEIYIRARHRTLYYVNDPEKTAETFQPDGWVRLGDVGAMNPKRQLLVFGRDKFSIIRGTLLIYPEPFEYIIRDCDGVKEVAAVGVPDERMNEEVCIFVVLEDGVKMSEKDLRIRCENQLANKDLIIPPPKYIYIVNSFPMNVNGKLDRGVLKSAACEMLRNDKI